MSETATAIVIPFPASAISTIIAADKDDILGTLKEELEGYEPDASTEDGRNEIGSKAKKVGVAKQNLIRLADGLKEDAQKLIKGVNAEVKIVETRMDEMRDAILAPRVAYQQREKRRIEEHEAALAAIAEHPDFGRTESSADLAKRLAHLEAYPQRQWEEFQRKATAAISDEIARTKVLLAAAQKREEEAAELERLRAAEAERRRIEAERLQAERDAKIATEAAEAARLAAEAEAERRLQAQRAEAERQQQEADRRAREAADAAERRQREIEAEAKREREAAAEAAAQVERDRQAEEDRSAAALAEAEHRAERERREAAEREAAQKRRAEAAEQQAAAARAQAERDAADAVERERYRVAAEAAEAKREEDRRAADREHRGKINSEAMADLVSAGLADAQARAAIVAIAKGSVRNIAIRY